MSRSAPVRSWAAPLSIGLLALQVLTAHAEAQAPTDPHAAIARMLPECGPRYAEIDARIARAGVADASYYRVAGFPYLRTDRLMSSFNGELDDDTALEAWLLQLRDNDQFSRDIELRNLGMDPRERTTLLLDLRLCAVWLSFLQSTDPEQRKKMIAAARVPAAPAVAEARLREAGPLPAAVTRRWHTPVDAAEVQRLLARYEKLPQDPLRRKGMTSDGWQALAAHFAPTWWIEGAAPGTLHWQRDRLAIDAGRPAVYYLPGFARAGEQLLVQFTYFLWFALAHGEAIDGLIWRVTLDPQGRPLVYDSLRADGGDHRFHLAQALLHDDRDASAPPASAIAGVGPVQVRLRAGSAAAIEVAPQSAETEAGAKHSYTLVPYEVLLTLPRADGTSLSAFDANGLLRQAGNPIHQWGRHATLASLEAAFDDPHLIESRFRLPASLSPGRHALLSALLQASNP
jgi:hypothetical protein